MFVVLKFFGCAQLKIINSNHNKIFLLNKIYFITFVLLNCSSLNIEIVCLVACKVKNRFKYKDLSKQLYIVLSQGRVPHNQVKTVQRMFRTKT